jgi:hypothetical protein
MAAFDAAYLDTSDNRPAIPEGLAREVEYILSGHKGSNRAITREKLLDQVRQNKNFRTVTDEQVRAAIGELRDQGRLIVNDMRGAGYFWAGCNLEYQAFREAYTSYAVTILHRAREMDRVAKKEFETDPLQKRLL